MPIYLNLPAQRAQIAMHTLAHEIGHVFLGDGHPEQGSGPAPLPGTDRSKRLMSSRTDQTARLLVKAEWDKAEEWLESADRRKQSN
jgi:hypothetical protein